METILTMKAWLQPGNQDQGKPKPSVLQRVSALDGKKNKSELRTFPLVLEKKRE